jgi:hypothetical protein
MSVLPHMYVVVCMCGPTDVLPRLPTKAWVVFIWVCIVPTLYREPTYWTTRQGYQSELSPVVPVSIFSLFSQ